MDWTRTEINELISLYRQYECLWDTSNENYNNFDTKQNAWQDIANACGKGVDDIRRKVKNLRSAYVSEKKKSEASKEQGMTYRPNLFYYNDMDFLEPVLVLRKFSLPSSTSQSFLSSRNITTREYNKERKHKIVKVDRKLHRDTKFNNAIDSIVASVKQIHPKASIVEEDDDNSVFNSFGKTTALQLQQLPLDKATEAMASIYQLVAKKTLDSLKRTKTEANKRKNGVINFETMGP